MKWCRLIYFVCHVYHMLFSCITWHRIDFQRCRFVFYTFSIWKAFNATALLQERPKKHTHRIHSKSKIASRQEKERPSENRATQRQRMESTKRKSEQRKNPNVAWQHFCLPLLLLLFNTNVNQMCLVCMSCIISSHLAPIESNHGMLMWINRREIEFHKYDILLNERTNVAECKRCISLGSFCASPSLLRLLSSFHIFAWISNNVCRTRRTLYIGALSCFARCALDIWLYLFVPMGT